MIDFRHMLEVAIPRYGLRKDHKLYWFARSLGKARKEFEAGLKEGMREGETRPEQFEGSRKDDRKA